MHRFQALLHKHPTLLQSLDQQFANVVCVLSWHQQLLDLSPRTAKRKVRVLALLQEIQAPLVPWLRLMPMPQWL